MCIECEICDYIFRSWISAGNSFLKQALWDGIIIHSHLIFFCLWRAYWLWVGEEAGLEVISEKGFWEKNVRKQADFLRQFSRERPPGCQLPRRVVTTVVWWLSCEKGAFATASLCTSALSSLLLLLSGWGGSGPGWLQGTVFGQVKPLSPLLIFGINMAKTQ